MKPAQPGALTHKCPQRPQKGTRPNSQQLGSRYPNEAHCTVKTDAARRRTAGRGPGRPLRAGPPRGEALRAGASTDTAATAGRRGHGAWLLATNCATFLFGVIRCSQTRCGRGAQLCKYAEDHALAWQALRYVRRVSAKLQGGERLLVYKGTTLPLVLVPLQSDCGPGTERTQGRVARGTHRGACGPIPGPKREATQIRSPAKSAATLGHARGTPGSEGQREQADGGARSQEGHSATGEGCPHISGASPAPAGQKKLEQAWTVRNGLRRHRRVVRATSPGKDPSPGAQGHRAKGRAWSRE